MRTEQRTIYLFNELSDGAKTRAIENYRNLDFEFIYPWHHEAWQSIQESTKTLPFTVDEADYDRRFTNHTITLDDDVASLTGTRAWKWLENNGFFDPKLISGDCPFTGCCVDEPILDPIREAHTNPAAIQSLEQLFHDCISSWLFAVCADIEYFYTDEAIAETLIANEYEYLADGSEV